MRKSPSVWDVPLQVDLSLCLLDGIYTGCDIVEHGQTHSYRTKGRFGIHLLEVVDLHNQEVGRACWKMYQSVQLLTNQP